MSKTQVFLEKVGGNNQPVDIGTVKIESGKFVFTGTANIPEMHYIFVDKLQSYTGVILENCEITLSAHKDSLGLAQIEGTL